MSNEMAVIIEVNILRWNAVGKQTNVENEQSVRKLLFKKYMIYNVWSKIFQQSVSESTRIEFVDIT